MADQMKILIYGNAGSGKTTLARRLSAQHGLSHLDLDCIVWEPGQVAVQRAPDAVLDALNAFIACTSQWVIEGCYGDLVAATAQHCTELVFLNPGVEACLANNRLRPWEPHKYASMAEQDAMLQKLQSWVAGYHTRDDAWSYREHRRVFDEFDGPKRELTVPGDSRGTD